MTIQFYNCHLPPAPELLMRTVDFLFRELGRFGDPVEDIRRAAEYALRDAEYAGGFICLGIESGEIIGAALINRTGMKSYIPENILVYIAVRDESRGRGIGRQLMEAVIGYAQGAIALHVEPDNPARRLYERLGFTNKYLEMRLDGKEVR